MVGMMVPSQTSETKRLASAASSLLMPRSLSQPAPAAPSGVGGRASGTAASGTAQLPSLQAPEVQPQVLLQVSVRIPQTPQGAVRVAPGVQSPWLLQVPA